MKHTLVAFSAFLAVFAAGAQAATCADRTHVVTQLETRFGETLVANAISSSRNVLEVFASDDKKTWSILVFLPERGLSCLVSTGKGDKTLKVALSEI